MDRRKFLGNCATLLGGLGLLSAMPSTLNALSVETNRHKRILIIFAHTYWNDSKINRKLLSEASKIEGVKIHNLTEQYANAKIAVDKEIELLAWADKIIMQFPLFWYSTPSLLKEWEDEVLVAVDTIDSKNKNKMLKGKTFQIITTAGGKESSYDGHHGGVTIKQLLLPIYHSFAYLDAKAKDPYCIYDAGNISIDKLPIKQYLSQIKS